MSNAIKGSNSIFKVSTAAASPKTITAVSATSPPIVSCSAHGFLQDDIIVIDGIVGMTQLNGRAFVVDLAATGASPQTNKFALSGVDATTYSAYISGGTATKQTMTVVAGVLEVSGFDGAAAEIDVTQIDSTAKEYVLGLQDFGSAALRVFISPQDPGQARLRTLRGTSAAAAYSVTLSSGDIGAFMAFVRQFSFSNVKADGAVEGAVALRITKEPSYFS